MITSHTPFLHSVCCAVLWCAAGTQQPSYSLIRDRTYATPLQTKRLDVEFFVRSEAEFEKTYPQGSSARYRLERSVRADMCACVRLPAGWYPFPSLPCL